MILHYKWRCETPKNLYVCSIYGATEICSLGSIQLQRHASGGDDWLLNVKFGELLKAENLYDCNLSEAKAQCENFARLFLIDIISIANLALEENAVKGHIRL